MLRCISSRLNLSIIVCLHLCSAVFIALLLLCWIIRSLVSSQTATDSVFPFTPAGMLVAFWMSVVIVVLAAVAFCPSQITRVHAQTITSCTVYSTTPAYTKKAPTAFYFSLNNQGTMYTPTIASNDLPAYCPAGFVTNMAQMSYYTGSTALLRGSFMTSKGSSTDANSGMACSDFSQVFNGATSVSMAQFSTSSSRYILYIM